jgi:predicted class III extradiol MEMO1 family dioxygenase
MDIIENLNPAQFTDYLKQYHNTICGRYPIGVSNNNKKNLHSIKHLEDIFHK